MKTSVWRLPPSENEDLTGNDVDGGNGTHHSSNNPLELLCDLDTSQYGKEVKVSSFHPTDGSRIMSVVDNHFLLFDVGESSPKVYYYPLVSINQSKLMYIYTFTFILFDFS